MILVGPLNINTVLGLNMDIVTAECEVIEATKVTTAQISAKLHSMASSAGEMIVDAFAEMSHAMAMANYMGILMIE